MEESKHTERCRILRFLWGRSRLPLSAKDFDGAHLTISPLRKAQKAAHMFLPEANPSKFLLRLPRYGNYEELKRQMQLAVDNAEQGGSGGGSMAEATSKLYVDEMDQLSNMPTA